MKRRTFVLAMPAAALALQAGGHRAHGDDKGQKSPPRSIPLNVIYITDFDQTGFRRVERPKASAVERDFNELMQHCMRTGASNIFLVRGENIEQGIAATRRTLMGVHSASHPIAPETSTLPDRCWLVVYFGTTRSGGRWHVKSATIDNKFVRLSFTTGKPDNADLLPYFAWVPLGTLEPGAYTLELFDAETGHVELMRRVEVEQKE